MTTISLVRKPSTAPHRKPPLDGRPITPRVPEWPGLTQHEIRKIILDVLG